MEWQRRPYRPTQICFDSSVSVWYRLRQSKWKSLCKQWFQRLGFCRVERFPYYGTSASTSGKHIVKVPANSGTEIIVGSWSLSASGTPDVNTSFSAVIDSREVFITSNIEPNYHRSNHPSGQGQRIQNVRNPDGSMVVDCLAPLGWLQNWFPVTITYSGTATGWSSLSYFQWKAALGIQGGETFWSGYFYPLPLYDAIAQYLTNSATPGSTEHISLTITDSTDSAVGKALYDVRFHDKYEPPVGQVVVSNHPLSPDPLANTAEWTFITESVNYTSVSLTTTVSFKVTHTEGWELSLNGETAVPPLLAQVFTGVTVGGKMSNTISKEDSYSQQVTTPPNRRTMFFQASPYAAKTGYCSQWNYSGFASDVPFSGRVYSDVAAVASVEKPL
jgi:hypothetical protein